MRAAFFEIRPCTKHDGRHIVDRLGAGNFGVHLTDCPDDPTYNATYAAAVQQFTSRAILRPKPKHGSARRKIA